MKATKAKIEQLARALFPRYGIHDVGSLVATITKYRNRDGKVAIDRPEGRWSWFASPGSTSVSPNRVTLAFPADFRRTAERSRADLYRQLEDASFSVLSEAEVEAALKPKAARRGATEVPKHVPPKKTPAQLDREVAALLDRPAKNLGMARAERLATALQTLGHEAEAFRQYNQWNSVGVHRAAPWTTGTWNQIISFTDDGNLVPPIGGSSRGTGNPWRSGLEHDAVEEAARWLP